VPLKKKKKKKMKENPNLVTNGRFQAWWPMENSNAWWSMGKHIA
jgi:hypothetical protein